MPRTTWRDRIIRTEGYYHDARNAIAELVKVGDLKGVREATQKLDDPYWRSVIFAEIAKVTHEAQDFEAAKANLPTGVSCWRGAAVLAVVNALVAARKFAAARALVVGEELHDPFWHDEAKKCIAQAQRR